MTTRKSGPYRLPYGGEIDRTRKIPFRFNGRTYLGHAGDTLGSALLANGVLTVARSFKFHRPRGIYSCGVEEPNALLTVGELARATPSLRAPMVELISGLEVRSQAGWPTVGFDLGRLLDIAAPIFAAGFYNKTFIWPSWHTYEPLLRNLAGLGRAPTEPDPDRYEVGNLHCDVLVVGAGIAGLTSALEAARADARVVLVEQNRALGGEAAWDGATIGGVKASAWVREVAQELARMPDVRVMTRTTAVGAYDHNVLVLLERTERRVERLPRERYWIVRAARVVLATGVIEQPLIFAHNDRPGILLAGAAREYFLRYGVAPGTRVLVATNNDSVYALAKDLKNAGIKVLGVTDSRPELSDVARSTMRSELIEVLTGSIPIETSGFGALKRVTVGKLSADGRSVTSLRTFKCDALAVSGGFAPALQLYAQAGGRLVYNELCGALQPLRQPGPTRAIEIVGRAAEMVPIGPRVSPVGKTHRQWVDALHDVTVADLELALRENFTAIEHVKRYTTVGMAADQGKTSAAATLEVLGKLRGLPSRDLGHTTLRPPVTPVTLGAIAGRELAERFAPQRHLPLHDWHLAHGALLQDFGGWQRPVAYLRAGESREEATRREAQTVRRAAGLFDGSSLGKIELEGPDALKFLDRFYINNLATLSPGRVRYGLMLRESGVLFDDGTLVALAPDRVLITTTSGNAGRVYAWLEEWHQCEWPELRVAITPVTEQWATLSLAGPDARSILSKLESDIDLSGNAFPHLTLREGTLLGVPARIYRVSFTGELTYEINVPADSGPSIWEALLHAGEPYGLQPFGVDALMLLRLEKGFHHVGADTDGTTLPDDVGWGKVAANKTRDYIGRRSLSLPEHVRPDRLQLVGLKSAVGENSRSTARPQPFIIGSHLRLTGSTEPTDGWITSAGLSALTSDPIALAMLRDGRQHVGAVVTVHDAGAPVGRAEVVQLPFFDPGGERMHG
jgi:sarcosine oxidase subunit alpha